MQKGHYYKKDIGICRICKTNENVVSYAILENKACGNCCRVCGNFWYFPKSLWYDKIIYDSDIYERQITLRGNGNS